VYPISKIKRKAADGRFASEIKDPEKRKKVLGSYYAVSNYTDVNSKFGSMEDFQNLVNTAHENGMYVILDWVANHTGWDNVWIKEHPEYYTHNDKGEIIDPVNPETGKSWGWTDTADLNYDNKDLWAAMTNSMEYWVKQHNVDGFRCDVAAGVPTEFWNQAVKKINKIHPIFMLAEGDAPDLLKQAFDMGYNWKGLHLMNEIAQGKATVKAWDKNMKSVDSIYENDDIWMNFITNHDENSWSGTVQERLGDASNTMLALTYTIPGMPLIYSGQEYGLDRRLKFFEKDSIPKSKGEVYSLMEKLGKLKNSNKALDGGKEAASYTRLTTSEDSKVLAFRREKGGKEVVYIANMTKDPVKFSLKATGNYTDYLSNEQMELKEGTEMNFSPWEYKILVNK
ncbi:MAG: alpha-amylase family glycosyl hydrolase, partial [Gillisia sp.]